MRLDPLRLLVAGLAGCLTLLGSPAVAYNPIMPTMAGQTAYIPSAEAMPIQ